VSDERRIVLTEDDFLGPAEPQAPPPASTVPIAGPVSGGPVQPTQQGLPPVVSRRSTLDMRTAAAPATPMAGGGFHQPTLTVLLAALVGMAVAWAVTEGAHIATLPRHAHTESGFHAYTGVWTGVIGVIFAAVLVGYDRALGGAWASATARAVRAALPAFAIGFGAGFAADYVYLHMVEHILRSAASNGSFPSQDDARLYFARAVGWGIFGCGIGVTLGALEKSRSKAVNGAIGGAIGGALGGLVFQYVAVHLHSEKGGRFLGIAAVGLLIAAATRAVETVRRDAWLSVVAGGMAGKEFILYHPVTRIGSNPDCEIYLLKDPAVEPFHAQIADQGGRRVLTASPAAPVYVNQAATTNHVLRSGDSVQIGKTVIAYTERALAPAPLTAYGPPR